MGQVGHRACVAFQGRESPLSFARLQASAMDGVKGSQRSAATLLWEITASKEAATAARERRQGRWSKALQK
jgi:hypothetical protein